MDIRGADLPLLLSLDVLIEEASVTRAAARLHISQPAMSAQLARLRELFGDALLVPSENGRGMVATPRALQLRAPLRAGLEQLDQVVSRPAAFDPWTAQRTFHIASNDNIAVMLGLGLIRQVEQLGGPGLKLAFRRIPLDAMVGEMERGEIDLLLGVECSMPAALQQQQLLTEDFRVAQRKGHPRGVKPISLAAYCAARHVIMSNDGAFHSFVDEGLARQGRRREVLVSVPQYSLVPPVLAATDYISLLPSGFLQRYADTIDTFAPPIEVMPFTVMMGWHPRSDGDDGHRWLRDLVNAEVAAKVRPVPKRRLASG